MSFDVKTETVKTTTVVGTLTYDDLLSLVRARVHIPPGVAVRIYVDVPGGDDWSNTELDIRDHPVQIRAVWQDDDAANEQG